VPPTTALRWIRMLTQQGVLVRSADPRDGRRVFMTLSEASSAAMLGYVAAVRQIEAGGA
jgi:DNA-binding MarR family transcriptional regulator